MVYIVIPLHHLKKGYPGFIHYLFFSISLLLLILEEKTFEKKMKIFGKRNIHSIPKKLKIISNLGSGWPGRGSLWLQARSLTPMAAPMRPN